MAGVWSGFGAASYLDYRLVAVGLLGIVDISQAYARVLCAPIAACNDYSIHVED